MRVYGSVTAVRMDCQLPSVQACRVKHTSQELVLAHAHAHVDEKARAHRCTTSFQKQSKRINCGVGPIFFPTRCFPSHTCTHKQRLADRRSVLVHARAQVKRQHKLHLKR